ncbi:chemotaxis protein CheW [candidate division KSB1 bacterium]|nr:chemotaxis protein CheW [candidate division KSB1 bacterium]
MTSANPPESGKKKAVKQLGGKYLTFFLANEEYGLEILKVVEIIGMMDVTPVPRTPRYIQGVINLRGKVIPVMDLRLKFGMHHVEQTDETVIIVVHAQGIEMGIIVDKVSEVLDINSESIEDSPAFGTEVNTEYILGIGKAEGNVKLLLDIDRVLSSQDIIDMQTAKAKDDALSDDDDSTE